MSVLPTSGIGASGSTPSTVGFNDLKSEDFFALMIAELQSQDPLKPQDNQQLLSQMSNIRQIEQSTRLADTLEAQVTALEKQTKILQNLTSQKFSDPASLIGFYVQGPGVNETGSPVIGSDGKQTNTEGLVIGLEYNDQGEAVLELHNGTHIIASKVERVNVVVADDGSGTPPPSEGPSGTNPPPDDSATARLKTAAMPNAKSRYSTNLLQNDSVAALLDSLFSPGLGAAAGF